MAHQRGTIGAAIVGAWLVGLGLLARREYFRPPLERLAEAATRVTPGAVFYGVMRDGRQVGFASSTIDTADASLILTDYLVADAASGRGTGRLTSRTNVTLSRAMRMTKFEVTVDTGAGPVKETGRLLSGGDTLLLAVSAGSAQPHVQRIALPGQVLLPALVPLAVALSERPKLGKRYVIPVFYPTDARSKDLAVTVRAESLFVVNDSAVYDSATARWHGVLPDTLRAWHVKGDSGDVFSAWIDEQGRLVQTSQFGFELRRVPYEVAFENWRADSTSSAHGPPSIPIPIPSPPARRKQPGRRGPASE